MKSEGKRNQRPNLASSYSMTNGKPPRQSPDSHNRGPHIYRHVDISKGGCELENIDQGNSREDVVYSTSNENPNCGSIVSDYSMAGLVRV
jgi:hypothetical protein